MDPLVRLAASPGGVFSLADVHASGVAPAQLRRLLRAGTLRRLRRGWFALGDVYDEAQLFPERGHRLEAAALVRAMSGDVVVSHESAAVIQRLAVLGAVPSRPLVTHVAPSGGGGRPGAIVAPVPAQQRVFLGQLPLTSPARTVVDIARSRGFAAGVVVADAALRRGMSRDELAAAVEYCAGWPGVPVARAVAGFADGRAESPLESVHRVAFHEAGLPRPQPQVWIEAPGVQIRVDFLWDEHRTVFESDGLAKYGSAEDFRDEKLREERLRELGFEVARGDWREAMNDRPAIPRKVLAAFARAGERPWPAVLPYRLVFTPPI